MDYLLSISVNLLFPAKPVACSTLIASISLPKFWAPTIEVKKIETTAVKTAFMEDLCILGEVSAHLFYQAGVSCESMSWYFKKWMPNCKLKDKLP